MLKAVNLSKTYESKTGYNQKALDNVNLTFDDTGMVFIFGKSGSGKSTLLNLLGGLDVMDSGHIEINDKSTLDFTKDDYDSYRNTYLGFVFQDFNILPEFTVEENVRFAYELQHKEVDQKQIDRMLKQMDMQRYAKRKPNELSGGQIQRISIARALVKNPHIILADEPTGNLDSETGEQVFKILKDLSKEKLVIVVSHDLEAAKKYANRIIELKDGKVVNDQIQQNDSSNTLSNTDNKNQTINNNTFHLIKSKLHNKTAFRMGKSSLKNKKGKLFLSIIMTVIAIALFGLSDVISAFTVTKASYNTYKDSTYSILPFEFEREVDGASYTEKLPVTKEQAEALSAAFNRDVYVGYQYNFEFYDILHDEIPYYNGYYIQFSSGVIELPDASAIREDYVGRFPQTSKEIMINNYHLEHFIDYGFEYYNDNTDSIEVIENVTDFSDVQNKSVRLRVGMDFEYFTIVGMVNYNLDKYHDLKDDWEKITTHSTYEETQAIDFTADQYSFLGRFIVAEGFNQDNYIKQLSKYSFSVANLGNNQDIIIELNELTPPNDLTDEERDEYLNKNHIDFSKFDIIDFDDYYFGSEGIPSELNDNQIIVPSNWFHITEITDLDQYLNMKLSFKLITENSDLAEDGTIDYQKEMTIVGFYIGDYYYMNYNVIVPNKVFDDIINLTFNNGDRLYTYLNHNSDDIKILDLLEQNNFKHCTSISSGIYRVTDLFGTIKSLFLYLSIILLIIVELLIMNFISTSIHYKQKEIGILRALGARKSDVFKIFFFEGLIISVISFLMTLVFMVIGIIFFNDFIKTAMHSEVVLVSLGIRQIAFVAIICFATMFLASYIPVHKFANKTPIKAMKGQ